MEKKPFLRLLVILLGLSSLVFAYSIPATSKFLGFDVEPFSMFGKMDIPLVKYHLAKEDQVMGSRNSKELMDLKNGMVESRMMVNIADYAGTRPNPAHDPKSPGKP
ncbi:hypothetical protein RJT34_21691 [Clitoria ternatea]|uniref:Uncharacterized protein n=1 Tax=Clitoria ternatea TaxID=43366 RepID=A0AAN9IUU9_CLITE